MASSRVMASSSSQAPPLPPQPPGPSDLARFRSGSGIGSMNMDDILRNIYGPEAAAAAAAAGGGGPAEPVAPAPPEAAVRRTVEEVWKEISAAGGLSSPAPAPAPVPAASTGAGGGAAEMTLEDFLARDTGGARAARVEGNLPLGFPDGDGMESVAGGGGGRARKRVLMDPTDPAAMQRQKRMIKNRESAARSRDRRQAYVAELESQVTQLEEEQAQLIREQEERNEKRWKELMEKAAPGIRKKPIQDLRRTNSMEW